MKDFRRVLPSSQPLDPTANGEGDRAPVGGGAGAWGGVGPSLPTHLPSPHSFLSSVVMICRCVLIVDLSSNVQ